MVNTRVKGRNTEKRAERELIADGWLVYLVKGTTKFNKNVDIFSMFDLVAIKGNKVRFSQIKTNSTGGVLKKIIKFGEEHKSDNLSFELWVWYDNKGWKKYGERKD